MYLHSPYAFLALTKDFTFYLTVLFLPSRIRVFSTSVLKVDVTIGTVTRPGDGSTRNRVRLPEQAACSSPRHPEALWAHPAFYIKRTNDSFPRV